MATIRSEQAQKIYDTSNAGGYDTELLNTNEYNGRVRLFYAHAKIESAIAAATTIELIEVPAGRILPISKIYHGAGGENSTLKAGYADYIADDGTAVVGDDDALLAAAGSSAAGSKELAANTAGVILTGKALITATTSAFAANKTLDAYIFCVVD